MTNTISLFANCNKKGAAVDLYFVPRVCKYFTFFAITKEELWNITHLLYFVPRMYKIFDLKIFLSFFPKTLVTLNLHLKTYSSSIDNTGVTL